MLIVGAGLTGSLTCYHLRAMAGKRTPPLRIDVADMARGPGGRMSTTRFGPDSIRANTGAQYLSAFSHEAAAMLETACAPSSACPTDRVPDPLKRSTHFTLHPDDDYTHWLPPKGTNAAVKQFLYGGAPDLVVFESRLQRVAVDPTSARPRLVPLFDSGGTTSEYDVVIFAMPPKDIVKFFNDDRLDTQSQADLHRRTNRGRSTPIPRNHQSVVLPSDVLSKLRAPSYVGRYSLAVWFEDAKFANEAARAWSSRRDPHPILDMVSSQDGGVLVAQSTVELWRRLNNNRGGGRGGAKAEIVGALEGLAGSEMPRARNTKLLNWRTSQARAAGDGVVTAEGGRLVFTGDWCFESSFEGCNLAAQAAATATVNAIISLDSTIERDAVVGGGARAPAVAPARSSTPPPTTAAPSAARSEGRGHIGGEKRPAPAPSGEEGGKACSGPCGATLPRSKFSKTQWTKPERSARCKDCVAASTNPG